MSKVFQLEHLRREKKFNENVNPFLQTINPTFEYYKKDDQVIFYFHYIMYIYIFMRYIPLGTKTDLPTIQESFQNIVHNPRISKGEWVVESLNQVEENRA